MIGDWIGFTALVVLFMASVIAIVAFKPNRVGNSAGNL